MRVGIIMNYQIGDIIQGCVTDVKPYAIFMKFDDQTSGLLHISELSDGFIKDIDRYAAKGDIIKVKIIVFIKKSNLILFPVKKNCLKVRKIYLNLLNYPKLYASI